MLFSIPYCKKIAKISKNSMFFDTFAVILSPHKAIYMSDMLKIILNLPILTLKRSQYLSRQRQFVRQLLPLFHHCQSW